MGDISVQTSDIYRNYVYNNYRDVPEQLKTRIAALCSQQGFRAGDDELDDKIAQYFQDNFVYDFKSGRLPWQTDFVEYFLFESKSGVCAHFATAATLMYRTLGIPARYVEGYCVDYANVMQGKAVDGDVSDWITGITPISNKVMSVELSDYNAHAWVEVYKDGIGWVTVDPTPYVDEIDVKEETEKPSTLEELMLYFQNADIRSENKGVLFEILAPVLSAIVRIVVYIVLLVVLYFVLRPIVWLLLRRFYLARGSVKYVAMMYDYLTSLAVYCGLTDGEMSFRDFFSMVGADNSMLRCTEKALYSKDGISKAELAQLAKYMRGVSKSILAKTTFIKRITAYFVVIK
jgi:hypothetical protein